MKSQDLKKRDVEKNIMKNDCPWENDEKAKVASAHTQHTTHHHNLWYSKKWKTTK